MSRKSRKNRHLRQHASVRAPMPAPEIAHGVQDTRRAQRRRQKMSLRRWSEDD